MLPSFLVAGVAVPSMMYGTAWKEEDTERHVEDALAAGFRAIDTANQRKHYFEAGVGAAIQKALKHRGLLREALFLQTKFTQVSGQDARLPYDPAAPHAVQVAQSFASSLEHMGVSYLDAYILHGPANDQGLIDQGWEIWGAMEAIFDADKARLLGISNVTLGQLEELYTKARVKPAMVQNRCYASRGWDREVRVFCNDHGIRYQGFSLLTANREVLAHRTIEKIAQRVSSSPEEVVLRFAHDVGMIVLTGTRSREHMNRDLAISRITLDSREIATIEAISG